MAETQWEGKAEAVAQVETVQITAYDAATTYKITIGGHTVSTIAAGSVNATATALAAALNLSTHPYFAAITWSAATDTVTATADLAGLPFVAVSSVSGGAGTIGAFAQTTAATSRHHWDNAENWTGGAVPVAGDDVTLANSSVNICWGLGQSAIDLDSLISKLSYTGKVGLNSSAYAAGINGESPNALYPEYRDIYLDIEYDEAEIGEYSGTGTQNGTSRFCLNGGVHANKTTIFATAVSSSETDRPAVRLLMNNAASTVFVRTALGGVGVAADQPGETSLLSKVTVAEAGADSKVIITEGVTYTNFEQRGGTNKISAAATIASVKVIDGLLTSEGDFTVTTWDALGGTSFPNHKKTAGNAITTLNAEAVVDATQSAEARTWDTVNHKKGRTLRYDPAVVTITNHAFESVPLVLQAS